MSEARAMEKHYNWRGGVSFEPYTIDWTATLRRSIRERDKYICQLCGIIQGDRAYCIHHIDYDKKNCNPDNLITLCVRCNPKVNFNRKYWTQYFYDRNNHNIQPKTVEPSPPRRKGKVEGSGRTQEGR